MMTTSKWLKPLKVHLKIPGIEDISDFIRNNWFLLVLILASIIIFIFSFQPEVETPDGTSYMLLGKQITEGRYGETFFHRLPLLPTIFAILYASGVNIVWIKFIVPLFFMCFSLVAVFILAREISNEEVAKIATLLLFCFPEFWRWGTKFLTDIPLLALSSLSIYFFSRAIEDKKYFIHMGIVMALALLTNSLSFILLSSFLFYILSTKLTGLKSVFKSKHFILGMLVMILIFFSAFSAVTSVRSANDLKQISDVVESATIGKPPIRQMFINPIGTFLPLLKFILFLPIIFAPFGMWVLWKRKSEIKIFRLVVFLFVGFLAFIFIMWGIQLRYFSFIFPFITLFAAEGFILFWRLLKKSVLKIAVLALFAIIIAAAFLNCFYYLSIDSGMQWGSVTLSEYATSLNGLIASDYLPHYINITADVITDRDFNGIFFRGNMSHSNLSEAGVKYAIISIYSEFARSPSSDTYHPSFLGLEIPFVSRPYTGDRVPLSYTFRSDLFKQMDSSPDFKKIKEIYRPDTGQKIFIIYEVL